MSANAARATAEQERSVARFLYEEARLLDERRFEEWLQLFDDDGVYWVPSQPDQGSARDTLSLFFESKPLLALRMSRLAQASMHAQIPPSRTLHHVGAVSVQLEDAGSVFEARSSLIVAEWRSGEGRWFAGRAVHRLRRAGDAFRIALKRVDLINCDAPQRALTVPF